MDSAVSLSQCIAVEQGSKPLSLGQAFALVAFCGVFVLIAVFFDRRMAEAEARVLGRRDRDDLDDDHRGAA